MKNFLIGLGLGVAGFTGFLVLGLLMELGRRADEATPALITVMFGLATAIMVIGPFYFWLVAPLSRRLRRAR